MDDQSLDQSAGDQKAQYRRLKKESAEQDERISQLYEKKLKQEKQLAEQDERLARLRSNSEFQDAQIKRQSEEIKLLKQELEEKDAEIKQQAAEIKRQAAEIKLLKQQLDEKEKKVMEQEEKLAQQGQKILELENEVGALRKIVNAMAEQFIPKDKHQKMMEEYEIELAGLTDHRDWQKSEAEQNLAHHLWDAEMEVKRLDYELTEHKKKRECYICLLHQTTNSVIGAQMETREFGDADSQTDTKQFADICTQTNGQVTGHWRLLIGLFIIVLVVCDLLYNQFGPFRIALMLHYIRGPPPF